MKKEKVTPYTEEWEKKANELARSEVEIYPGRCCGNPVVKGYCCTFCGSNNPR